MGRTHSKNEGQQVDQTLHRVATKEREEIKRSTMQKMARRLNKEGGNHPEQESNRQKTMEDIHGGLYLQLMDKATVKSENLVKGKLDNWLSLDNWFWV